MSTTSPAANRLRAGHGKKTSCIQCGSEHFYEVQSSQYLTGGFGTVEILQDTDAQTFSLLKCAACDFPVLPKPDAGRKAGGIYESARNEFRASILKGQELIRSLDPQAIETKVMVNSAGKAEVATLTDRVKVLEEKKLHVDKLHTDKNRAAGSTATGNESSTV